MEAENPEPYHEALHGFYTGLMLGLPNNPAHSTCVCFGPQVLCFGIAQLGLDPKSFKHRWMLLESEHQTDDFLKLSSPVAPLVGCLCRGIPA